MDVNMQYARTRDVGERFQVYPCTWNACFRIRMIGHSTKAPKGRNATFPFQLVWRDRKVYYKRLCPSLLLLLHLCRILLLLVDLS